MPQSEMTSPGDGGGLCCCLGSSREKAHDQPVTLIKSEPITSQPNSNSLASPGEPPMNGIRTKTAERSIDGFEEVSLEMKTLQQALPDTKSKDTQNKDTFNITDMQMDALCTEEESGEQIVEDEPDISANVIEEVDEAELNRLTHKGFPSVTRDEQKSADQADDELTFKQMMAEDYERRKKELLKEIESAEEQEREEKEEQENDSNRSFLNLELESDKGSEARVHASPSIHRVEMAQKNEDQPSTSHEDSDREGKEGMRRKRSVEDEKREIERNRVEQELMNEIETLDLEEVIDEDHKWEEKKQLSERELKKTDEQFREVVPQLSARSGNETDVESDDEDDEEEIMIDRHTETLPVHRVPVSQMYSKMSESDDESDDEEDREVIVPPPRKIHQQKDTEIVASSDEDSGNGNTRPDSSSEKENATHSDSPQINDHHITRVSLKSNGTSTVVVDGDTGGVRVSLDHPPNQKSLEHQLTDDEFSEKLI
ncbi:unnamed protein product, partial [Mesorhabditis belari]|uniref:Uncharacterized protein n=1 Tax=Mesorhabditis belari TaxID=2138241 RepID=A0AAF3FFT6_9BILA